MTTHDILSTRKGREEDKKLQGWAKTRYASFGFLSFLLFFSFFSFFMLVAVSSPTMLTSPATETSPADLLFLSFLDFFEALASTPTAERSPGTSTSMASADRAATSDFLRGISESLSVRSHCEDFGGSKRKASPLLALFLLVWSASDSCADTRNQRGELLQLGVHRLFSICLGGLLLSLLHELDRLQCKLVSAEQDN
jgi:hypothetical protein